MTIMVGEKTEAAWLLDEIERAQAELAHWQKVHAEHPDWANPKMQVTEAKGYLRYLRSRKDAVKIGDGAYTMEMPSNIPSGWPSLG